jgi:signal transduction histidine kinase
MAQAPSRPARAPAVAARTGATRLWWAWLAIGVALTVAYALTPEHYLGVRDFALYPPTDLGAALAIVIGVYLFRPSAPAAWLLIAAYALFTLGGDLTWGVYEVSGRSPDTSLADVFYLAGYPCAFIGLLIAVLRRSHFHDRRELIDSAIVGTSAFLLVWVYIVNPYVFGQYSWTEAFIFTAYPVGDMIVLAAAVRLMLGGRWNVTALRLLLVGLVLTLGGDIAYAADATSHIAVVDTLLQLGIVAIGLAGLHWTMTALTSRAGAEETKRGSGFGRLVLLVGICAVPLVVLAVQAVRGDGLHLVAVLVTAILLAALVVARSLGLTTTAEEAAEREATLSRYAAELLRTEGEDQLYAVAGRTASELVGRGEARIVDRGAVDPAHRHGFTTSVEVRGEVVAALVADGEPSALRRVSGSLSNVAAQLSLALERERLLETEREAAEALARRNEELRELDRMKDSFVSGVSHELRTPLTSMIGYLELLREGEAGELSDEQQHFLEIVERNSHRLNDLIDDILFMSRLDSGRFRLERASVDLDHLVADRVESIQPAARQKAVDVQVRTDETAPHLWADPARLTQVLDNLLSNAVKFTPEGGKVFVTVSGSNGTAHLEVRDTGVGIPEDEAARLFERFFRASTAQNVKGTGLGLSIAKAIVEAHGGTISVQSRVAVGTTVAVDLPLEAQEEATVDGAAEEVTA